MTADVLPDSWQEQFLFSIEEMDGDEQQYAGITEDITGMDFGDKDIEGVALANGGRIVKWTPQADESMTLKVWDVDASTDGEGVVQLFNWQATEDTADPIRVLNSRLRKPFQIILTWAKNIADLSTAGTLTTANIAAYRITIKNAYMTSCKPSFDDKNKSAEITFKWTPFGREGTENKMEESTVSTAIPAKTSFTEATRYDAFA